MTTACHSDNSQVLQLWLCLVKSVPMSALESWRPHEYNCEVLCSMCLIILIYNGGLRAEPHQGPGAERLVRGSGGGKAPLKLRAFYHWNVQQKC